MRKLLFAVLISNALASSAQYSDNYFDVGVFGGVSSYSGDLGGAFNPKDLNFAVGAFGRYNIGKWVSVKGSFNYGIIGANDLNSNNDARKYRNLNFRSNILEFGVTGEWNMLGFHPRGLEKVFSPYAFVGINFFSFNPQTKTSQGDWVNLRDVGTEGQQAGYRNRSPYATFQVAVPMGAGIKWAINSKWSLGFEVGFRRTFTDYLDDVSLNYVPVADLGAGSEAANLSNRTLELLANPDFASQTQDIQLYYDDILTLNGGAKRGDDNDYDWYIFTGITLSYHFIDEGLVGSRKRGRRKPGCKGAGF